MSGPVTAQPEPQPEPVVVSFALTEAEFRRAEITTRMWQWQTWLAPVIGVTIVVVAAAAQRREFIVVGPLLILFDAYLRFAWALPRGGGIRVSIHAMEGPPKTESDAPITVSFSLDEEELVASCRAILLRRASVWGNVLVGAGAFVVGLALIPTTHPGLSAGLIVGGLIWGFGVLFSCLVFGPHRTWSRNELLRGEQSQSFDEEALQVETAQSRSRVQWTVFTRVIATSNAYVLVLKSGSFLTVPRRAFASEADEQRFRDLTQRRVVPLDPAA
jgi:hypothetical protein